MTFAAPNTPGSKVQLQSRYGNYIGGEWVEPKRGQYFENTSPVNGKVFAEIPRSTSEDIDRALDAAHKAAPAWGKTSPAERAIQPSGGFPALLGYRTGGNPVWTVQRQRSFAGWKDTAKPGPP